MKKFRSGWEKLKASSNGDLIVRMGMFANDMTNVHLILALATDRYSNYKDFRCSIPQLQTAVHDSDLRFGITTYAFRMLLGHIREGVRIIPDLRKQENDLEMRRYLSALNCATLESYDRLKKMWPIKAKLQANVTNEEKLFFRYICGVRDSLGFHYDKNLIKQAIDGLADNNTRSFNAIVGGDDCLICRFPASDSVIAKAIVKYIWGAEKADKAETEVGIGEVMQWVNGVGNDLYLICCAICEQFYLDHPIPKFRPNKGIGGRIHRSKGSNRTYK